jgi:hypothetical protein
MFPNVLAIVLNIIGKLHAHKLLFGVEILEVD